MTTPTKAPNEIERTMARALAKAIYGYEITPADSKYDQVRSQIAALETAGLKIMPVKATVEMEDAGWNALPEEEIGDLYSAMLDAFDPASWNPEEDR